MIKSEAYRICTKTVMDNTADPNIVFDENGVCNYWYDYMKIAERELKHDAAGQKELEEKILEIKKAGRNKSYDCILGVSGGVDSTYTAYLVKKYGLRPLAVHFDNGWNSETAVQNIHNIVQYLGCDLHTLVVDWEEFKDLQLAYLKASVIDIEVITDHAIFGTLYRLGAKYNIKYVISGTNVETEALIPRAWIYNKLDAINIRDIHQKFGQLKLKTYPFFGVLEKQYYLKVKRLEFFSIINYMPYNKNEVKKLITEQLGWSDYGGKHFESVFTRFYQAYILPKKFGVDKRRAHLSNLICSGQLTREEALKQLEQPIIDKNTLATDMEFVLKKFNLSKKEFEEIMVAPPVPHNHYLTEGGIEIHYPYLKPVKWLYNKLK